MNAIEYNKEQNGKLWHVVQLPAPLQAAWVAGPLAFVDAIASLQQLCGLAPADGKLGPATLARIGAEPIATPTLQGVDVSGYQPPGHFDAAKLKATPPAFAYVKVSQEGFTSNKYAQWHADTFLGVGSAVGFYHFGDVSEPPEKQAELLAKKFDEIAKGRPTLPPCLDLEWLDDHNALSDAKFRDWLPRFFGRLKLLTGRAGVLYTGPSFWAEHVGAPLELDALLWTVDYSHPEAPPSLPRGFTTWTFRQYSGEGRLPWFDGKIDLDVFNGDTEALAKLVA